MDCSPADRVRAFRVDFFPGFLVVTVFVAFLETFFLAMAMGREEAGRMPNLGDDVPIWTVSPLKIHDCLN